MLKLIAVAGLCLSAGCRTPTMGAVLQEKSRGGGSSRVYRTSPKQAWEIALQVLRWEGAGTIEEHHEGQFMLTTIYDRYAASANSTPIIGRCVVTFASAAMRLAMLSRTSPSERAMAVSPKRVSKS